MRIGVVTSSYAISPEDTVTAGVFVRDLAEQLAGLGHQVHVLAPAKHGARAPSPIQEYYIPWLGGDKDLASASMRNPITLFRFSTLVANGLWTIPRYAHTHRLEALVAMWAIPSGLFCWWAHRRYGIPYGVWALGSDIWARTKYPFGDRIVRRVLHDARFRFADGVMLAREAGNLAGATCEFVPSVRQLPTGCQPRRVDLAAGVPHLLFVGRYERNKGPDILVQAMKILLDGGSPAHLHMFGVGRLEPQLRAAICGHEEQIHLNGYADPETVIAYMSACDRLVIPSRIESIPLVFVDAIQMRLPVIAAAVGDLGELVQRLGVGVTVPPVDPPALAQELGRVRAGSRQDVTAWEAASDTFSLPRSAALCAQALDQARQVRS